MLQPLPCTLALPLQRPECVLQPLPCWRRLRITPRMPLMPGLLWLRWRWRRRLLLWPLLWLLLLLWWLLRPRLSLVWRRPADGQQRAESTPQPPAHARTQLRHAAANSPQQPACGLLVLLLRLLLG